MTRTSTSDRAEDPQPGGARRGTVTSVQVLTVPGRPERGDEVFVRHTCRGADWFDQVNHFAALPVSRVVRLRCGCCWRVEATRCDGTAVHVLVDREGRETGPGLPPGSGPFVTAGAS